MNQCCIVVIILVKTLTFCCCDICFFSYFTCRNLMSKFTDHPHPCQKYIRYWDVGRNYKICSGFWPIPPLNFLGVKKFTILTWSSTFVLPLFWIATVYLKYKRKHKARWLLCLSHIWYRLLHSTLRTSWEFCYLILFKLRYKQRICQTVKQTNIKLKTSNDGYSHGRPQLVMQL